MFKLKRIHDCTCNVFNSIVYFAFRHNIAPQYILTKSSMVHNDIEFRTWMDTVLLVQTQNFIIIKHKKDKNALDTSSLNSPYTRLTNLLSLQGKY